MSGVARRVVLIAAALLPTAVRQRYREQWLGELRDAPELEIRASEIAMGSLAFAATFARTTNAGRRLGPDEISRRERLALALSASAAVLAFSQFASGLVNAQVGTDPLSFAVGLVWTALTIYVVIAPLTALITVVTTRGTSWKARAAVAILASMSALPLARGALSEVLLGLGRAYVAVGTIAVPTLGIVVFAGVIFVRRIRQRWNSPIPWEEAAARMRSGAVAGLVVVVVVAAGFAGASTLWASRTPLFFTARITNSNRAEFEQWVSVKSLIEYHVTASLNLWLVTGLLLAAAVTVLICSRGSTLRRTISIVVIAVSVVVVSFGAMVSFLQLLLPDIAASYPLDLVTEVGQIALIACLLAVAGAERSLRAERPADERHQADGEKARGDEDYDDARRAH